MTVAVGDRHSLGIAAGHSLFTMRLGRAEQLARLRAKLRTLLSGVGAHERTLADVLLALEEACTNGITHGADERGKGVHVALEVSRYQLRVTVRDFGRGWYRGDRTRGSQRLDPLAESGRGFALMEALMDSVEVVPASPGTLVCMTKQLEGRCVPTPCARECSTGA